MRIEKTVFISYRRTNIYHARAVYQSLTAQGYDVFMDYASIDSGAFDQIILRQIDARAHFLVLLTPSALERCAEPGDWLRLEIEHAMDVQRNIVPLMFDKFDFGSMKPYLTGRLAALAQYNGLTVPAEYFDEAMARLSTRFLNTPLDAVIHPTPPEDRAGVQQRQAEAASAPKPTEQQLSAEQYFERGNKRYDQDDLDGAIADYDEAIRLNPKDAKAYFNRGLARYNQSDYSGAIADYSEAIQLNPQYVNAYVNRGNARDDQGDYSRAIADYSEAIRLNPKDAKAYVNRGGSRGKQGDTAGAIADLDEAIRLNPQMAEAYNNRGTARVDLGDTAGAIADYDEAIRLNPQHANAYNNRGVARYSQQDHAGAIMDYTEALRLNPQYAAAYNNRGEVHFASKQYDQALDDFKKANELMPGDNYVLAGLAITYHAAGNVQEARRLWHVLVGMDARYRDADWVKTELNWADPLVEEARKLIAGL